MTNYDYISLSLAPSHMHHHYFIMDVWLPKTVDDMQCKIINQIILWCRLSFGTIAQIRLCLYRLDNRDIGIINASWLLLGTLYLVKGFWTLTGLIIWIFGILSNFALFWAILFNFSSFLSNFDQFLLSFEQFCSILFKFCSVLSNFPQFHSIFAQFWTVLLSFEQFSLIFELLLPNFKNFLSVSWNFKSN